jgi:glycosyltransferase involved in cell wall biosynthesis
MVNVSVVVRCAGRENLFQGVLDRLHQQTIKPSEIIIIMDSWNQEEVIYVNRCLKEYSDSKLITFEHEKFSHPYSTNLGIASSKEELVCITNGHALPISLHWLEDGLTHFEDEDVAGVGGFSYPFETGFCRPLFNLIEVQYKRINGVCSRFSTINCIIRRSRWLEYPFDEGLLKIIPETRRYGGEDYDWPLEMISRGYKILLDQNLSVIHIHEDDPVSEILRNLKDYFVYYRLHRKIKQRARLQKIQLKGKFLT